MIRLYERKETNFQHNGIGILKDVISCSCSEVLNGKYDLEFEYPITGAYIESIVEENIIKAPVGNPSGEDQLFRIKMISKQFRRIKVYAIHIFYDLSDNFLEDVSPKDKSGDAAIKWIQARTVYKNDFVASSDITKIATARYVRRNFVDALIGSDNSFINTWGGELYRNNKTFAMNKNKGIDRGVQIRYGKNMKEITWDIDITGIVTRIYPVGFDGLMLPEKYIDSPLINNYINPKIQKMEFPEIQIDEENGITEEIALEQLRNVTNTQYELGIDKPTMTIQVNFLELSRTEEYKQNYSSMEKIYLGDFVEAIVPHLNLKEKLKVVSTKYDVLAQKYIEFELSNLDKKENSFINSTKQLIQKLEKVDTNVLNGARKNVTKLIANALGGHVYKTRNELFIMDSENPSEAKKVWRWNINGLGYSSTGISGPYGIAITSDGQIVADYITTGKLNANLIEGYGEMLLTVSNMDSQVTEIKATSTSNATKISNVESSLNATNNNINNLSQSVDATNTKITNVENTIDETNEKITNVESSLNTTKNNINSLSEEMESTAARITSVANELNTTNSNVTILSQSVESTNTKITDVENTIDETNTKITNVENTIDETNTKITNVESSLKTTNNKVTSVESSLKTTNQNVTNLSNEVENTNTSLSELSDSIDATNTKVTNVESSLNTTNTKVTSVENSLKTTNTNLSNLEDEVDATNTKVTNVESGLQTTNTKVSNVESSLATTNTKVTNVENGLKTTNTNLSNLEGEVDTANSNASSALSKANTASSNASSALSKANTNASNITKLNTSVSQLQLTDDEIKASVADVTTYVNEQVDSITTAQETKYAEIDVRAESIESSISAISQITTTTSNNYQELSKKFNDYTPTSKTIQLEQSLSTLQTNTYTKTEINTKLTDGSVTKVRTTSGTFDENGMHYAKTNAPTTTTINEVGVGTKKSNSSDYVLFAGYVDDNNTQYEKYKGQTIVASENMLVDNYLVIGGNSRLENYENGTGIFVL